MSEHNSSEFSLNDFNYVLKDDLFSSRKVDGFSKSIFGWIFNIYFLIHK